MANETIYTEHLSSNKTTALFVVLTVLFLAFSIWRINTSGMDGLAITLIVFSLIFLFYVVNYRRLEIKITEDTLKLKFGIFTWAVPLDNIESSRLDKLPPFLEYGGAGIHFFVANGRYRASFNFLEYPRVVISFKRKAGPVCDISFSTREPLTILQILRGNTPEVT